MRDGEGGQYEGCEGGWVEERCPIMIRERLKYRLHINRDDESRCESHSSVEIWLAVLSEPD